MFEFLISPKNGGLPPAKLGSPLLLFSHKPTISCAVHRRNAAFCEVRAVRNPGRNKSVRGHYIC